MNRKHYPRNSTVPFSSPNWDLGPHFWNPGTFTRITMIFACCQHKRHGGISSQTECDVGELVTFIAGVCVQLSGQRGTSYHITSQLFVLCDN